MSSSLDQHVASDRKRQEGRSRHLPQRRTPPSDALHIRRGAVSVQDGQAPLGRDVQTRGRAEAVSLRRPDRWAAPKISSALTITLAHPPKRSNQACVSGSPPMTLIRILGLGLRVIPRDARRVRRAGPSRANRQRAGASFASSGPARPSARRKERSTKPNSGSACGRRAADSRRTRARSPARGCGPASSERVSAPKGESVPHRPFPEAHGPQLG